MNERISIIGGSGFIGSSLIRQLKADQVINLDKRNSTLVPTRIINITDPASLQGQFNDTAWVVLLAAEHKDNVDPISLYYEVNVEGTRNVLNEMRKANVHKIIFTSTVAVYGLNKENPDENSPVDPFNDYGKSKYQAEEVLRAWHAEKPEERTLIIIRPTVVFGPENRGNVYNLLKQILSGKFRMIGKGENKKSMSYVENVSAFINYLMVQNQGGYQLYNYADKPDLTTNELINIIYEASGKKNSSLRIPYPIGYLAGLCFDILSKVSGKEFSISSVRIRKFCSTTQFSNKKVADSSFRPSYTLAQGLDITIKSLLTNI